MAKAPPKVDDAEARAKLLATYEHLKKIRESKICALKPIPMLRTEIVGIDGKTQPFRLRYYQVQGIYHLLAMKRMVLADGTGLGKCLTQDTLLISDRGMIPINALMPSALEPAAPEGFYPLDEPTSIWTGSKLAQVKNFYWSGVKPSVQVSTRNGFRVEGSLIHPIYIRNALGEGFKQLHEVVAGDFLCVDRNAHAPFPQKEPTIRFDPSLLANNAKRYDYPATLTTELATLLGYIVAEGCRGKYGIAISQSLECNPEPHTEIRHLLKSVFGWEGNKGDAHKDVAILVSSTGIKAFVAKCGVGEELSHDKFVPPCVMQGTRKNVQAFLSALIEAEGSVVIGGVEFSSSSKRLIHEVHLLLLRFGVVSRVSPKWVKGFDHTYWKLTFFCTDAQNFQQEIGFRSSRKRLALSKHLATTKRNPNKDLVPHTKELVRTLRDLIRDAAWAKRPRPNVTGWGLKQYGESFQGTLKHVISGRRNSTGRFLQQLLKAAYDHGLAQHSTYAKVQCILDRNFFYDPIVDLKKGTSPLMDLEIEDASHQFVGNGLLNHNTIEAIGALCYLWSSKEPDNKVIIVTPKSALRQWAAEFEKFTIGVQCFPVSGTLSEREEIYEAWVNAPTGPGDPKSVLILNYAILIRDWDYGLVIPLKPDGSPDPKTPYTPGLLDKITRRVKGLVVTFDEAQAFKNTKTKTWQTCRFLSDRAQRCYGLTATLLKNNLIEGFGIYKVIHPEVFSSKYRFMEDYCVTRLQAVGGKRKVPIVIGYKNLAQFRATIDPYFLGRPKHAVSDELPKLLTKEVLCGLTPAEESKYEEALSGFLELGDGEIREYEEHKAFVSLIYCQQVVNSLHLLKFRADDDIFGRT
jgi:hypothetical protein